MDGRQLAILITLVVYKAALLAIGLWAQKRTRNDGDFLLGGRRLGPLVTAISASASSSSVWTLLGVSGFAYANGISAVWLFPGCVGGFVLNWYGLAPRLRSYSADIGAVTATDVLARPRGSDRRDPLIAGVASLIVLASLTVYVANQFLGAGETFVTVFQSTDQTAAAANSRDGSATTAILAGAAIVVAYTLLGGFWAVSVTDTVQGLLMAVTAVVLPVAAWIEVGGMQGLGDALGAMPSERYLSLGGPHAGMAAGIGFVAGLLGIGLGYPGQPHVVNRFMAVRDDTALQRARIYSLLWASVVYSGMLVLGWCGRGLIEQTAAGENGQRVLMALTGLLFHPVLAGVMIAAVLSAIMSTADSQLLVAAGALSHDLGRSDASPAQRLRRSRVAVLVLSAAATVAAVYGSRDIFSGVLFAWSAMGAAFGPLLLLIVWRGPLSRNATLAAMVLGFSLSVGAHLGGMASSIERIVPVVVATAAALWLDRRGHQA